MAEYGTDGRVEVDIMGSVAVLTLSCDQNRFNNTMIGRINRALDQVESNERVQALVTTADGPRFSTGLDLPWLRTLPTRGRHEGTAPHFLTNFTRLLMRVLTFPMPTVAAINGHAVAGGAIFALAHDVRIMQSDSGWFWISEVWLGLPIRGKLKALIREKIPNGAAFSESVVLGKRLVGRDAERLGIVQATCPGDTLRTTSIAMATNLVSQRPYRRAFIAAHKQNMYSTVVNAEQNYDLMDLISRL